MKTGTEKEVLHIEDLSYAYEKNVPVLKGISMDANHGESIGLIGANGVGKSTFLKLLSGVLRQILFPQTTLSLVFPLGTVHGLVGPFNQFLIGDFSGVAHHNPSGAVHGERFLRHGFVEFTADRIPFPRDHLGIADML